MKKISVLFTSNKKTVRSDKNVPIVASCARMLTVTRKTRLFFIMPEPTNPDPLLNPAGVKISEAYVQDHLCAGWRPLPQLVEEPLTNDKETNEFIRRSLLHFYAHQNTSRISFHSGDINTHGAIWVRFCAHRAP